MEPHDTVALLQKAAKGMRGDIAYQIARVTHGALVSIVRPPDWSYDTIERLNRMVHQTRETGKPAAGCAIGTVPNGPDIIVAVTGLSTDACTIAAEHLAEKAARICAGESLA